MNSGFSFRFVSVKARLSPTVGGSTTAIPREAGRTSYCGPFPRSENTVA